MVKKNNIDKIFLGIVIALVVVGLIAFTSASLGVYAKNETKFYGIIFGQFVFGFLGGLVALLIDRKSTRLNSSHRL